jgi:hypothetical protein
MFTANYFFNPVPSSETTMYLPLIIVFSLTIFGSIIAKLPKDGFNKKVGARYFVPFLTIGILGFIYLFARYEGLPYLASRFFLALILLALITIIAWNFVWTIRFIPKMRAIKKNEERYKKYLPKAKAKKQ